VILGIYIYITNPNPSKDDILIGKLKRHKSPGSDQIPEELIQAERETLLSEIHNLFNYS
jgi:hypothetical protein